MSRKCPLGCVGEEVEVRYKRCGEGYQAIFSVQPVNRVVIPAE
ncbi:hypothetical protein P9213_08950 [Geobacillus stearothermophilus]|nr:hypothetical protein [Geobacillus stearothermophilus]MED4356773.1 hypothetical protein [Geobacillus stearothermophilus]